MKNVAILFGGISPEHEVSIITGLQVVENIDKNKYKPYVIYVTPSGELKYYKNLKNRKQFDSFKGKNKSLCWFKNINGQGFLCWNSGVLEKKVQIDIAYTAFHGGNGEGGEFQGLLYSMGIPTTSCFSEGSVITQNKVLTKQVLSYYNINTANGIGLFSRDILTNYEMETVKILKKFKKFPLIIKPAHLGSSIGIKVAHDEIELSKALLEAANLDTEVLVEEFVKNFSEYNCSVRTIENKVVCSLIEKPIAHDEILSFSDKYQKGSKSKSSGMASLDREIPAEISKGLSQKIQKISKNIYEVTRCKGLVRIDFMVTEDQNILLTEINSIPGSMSFYIWEAEGISFQQQITESLEQGVLDFLERKSKDIIYETDIVKQFVNN
jgi:D-alanine-D-alanine ligase